MPVPPAQVDEAFRAMERRGGGRRGVVGLGLVALAAAALLAFRLVSPAAPEPSSPLVMASGSDPMSTVLGDGSTISIAPGSRVVQGTGALGEMVYELEAGRVECDVTPRPERRFIVWAGGVRVRVLGTRFTVDVIRAEGEIIAVEIAVARGRVEVTAPGGDASHLEAGQRLRIDLAGPREDGALGESEPVHPVVGATILEESPASHESDGRHESDGPRTAAAPAGRPARRGIVDARALFDEGRALEAEGDVEDAIERFELLLREHPRDSRAPIVAFEIGRLRMDRLGDSEGAARAFRRAIAIAPDSPLGDDALARLVRLADRPGAVDECRRLRREYLESHPAGRHRDDVVSRCP